LTSIDGIAQGWAVLNELLGNLEKEGVFIPDLTYGDLRNTKMVIEYLRSFQGDIAGTQKADVALESELVQKIEILKTSLMAWAEDKFGEPYRKDWESKFTQAMKMDSSDDKKDITPISDIPREKDVGFFRIKLPDDIPVEVVSEIAEDCEVLISLDGDRHLQVSGKRDCVRDAMKRIGDLFYGKSVFDE
jgi:hypothetical protein